MCPGESVVWRYKIKDIKQKYDQHTGCLSRWNDMTVYEEKQRLFDKYRDNIAGFGIMYRKSDIPERKYKNIKRKFDRDPKEKGILGFYDTSLLCNGTEGYIFADNYICYKIILDAPKMIYYRNIRKYGFV